MKRLENKVCLVTGSTKGIGEKIIKKFLEEGGIAVVNSRNYDDVKAEVEKYKEMGYEDVYGASCDVSNKESVVAMMQDIKAKYGRIDVLVNNAGINCIKSSYDLEGEDYIRVLMTNLVGGLFCAQEAGKIMKEMGGGSIINIASIFGQTFTGMRASYSSSKSGLIGLTKVLAVEWAKDNIRVNAVGPGYIKTELDVSDQSDGGYTDEDINRRTPMGRYGSAEEVANVVAFLASDEASYVTGECYNVDGGWLAFGGWC